MLLSELSKFIQQGGEVIFALLLLAIILWTLIIERYYFFYRSFPQQLRKDKSLAQGLFTVCAFNNTWQQDKVMESWLSQSRQQLSSGVSTIKTLIAICPLLGLLGTVTGMVSVFDTIAITGNSDAKAMAAGIFRATLPTMSGLVLALSALYFHYHLSQKLNQCLLSVRHDLQLHLQRLNQ